MFWHQIKSLRSPMELLDENMIVKHLSGSRAYGLATENSDTDYRGIFAADPVNILTPWYPVKECEDTREKDTKLYELRHFVKLCLDCNPNIIETLWVDDSDILSRTPAYDFLRENRSIFLNSRIAYTTSGYAFKELRKMKSHNKWINNPKPKEPPQPYQFVSMVRWFGESKLFPRDFNIEDFHRDHRLIHYGTDIYAVYADDGYVLYNTKGQLNITREDDSLYGDVPLLIVKFNRQEYKNALKNHRQYWDWKKNRNEARSALEEKFGYDTKNGLHTIRLLRMGIEALRDGTINVRRKDADELMEILDGKWKYEEIVEYAKKMDEEIKNIYLKNTSLNETPDYKKAAEILLKTFYMVWENHSQLS